MKKLIAMALAGVLALSMAACGAQSTETTATAAAETAGAAAEAAKLSGTVTLAGSTSMQKLCEAMIESFEESYPDITVTAEYTGSGAGLALIGFTLALVGLGILIFRPKKKKGRYSR